MIHTFLFVFSNKALCYYTAAGKRKLAKKTICLYKTTLLLKIDEQSIIIYIKSLNFCQDLLLCKI